MLACGLFSVVRELPAVAETVPAGRELDVQRGFLLGGVIVLTLVLLDGFVVQFAVLVVPFFFPFLFSFLVVVL